MEPGKKLYIMVHAYQHFIAEIVEMLGPQRARVKNVRRIQSDSRDWSRFFAEGMKKSATVFTVFPDGELSWFACFDWPHEIIS